ncbi:MAG TPA: efflux RND transporter permease subunit, partial [Bacteroidetes bacterium]|nr:efflux RND transporter permease subunit [Bacteroidota bacterium]
MSENNNKKHRSFWLTNFALENATSIVLLTLMIFFFGLKSYKDIPKELMPEIKWPQVFVTTMYFGNSAEDIENLITRPIEKELNTITGIKNVSSTSIQDVSFIIAEFESDVDLDDATGKVKDAVDKAKSELPDDLKTDPVVKDVNLSEIPIMIINISGNYSNDELKSYAEYLEDEIESLDEISDVVIKGAQDREVKVDVDLAKMNSMEISYRDIQNAISSENLTMSAGQYLKNGFRANIRIEGEFKNVNEIKNIIIKAKRGKPIYIKDIADVSFNFKDKSSIARNNGEPVFALDVIKRSGENLLDASDKIKEIVKNAKTDVFPKDLDISLFNDQSVHTRKSVSNLENSIISGMILVLLILMLFLGLRNAGFVATAIPLSMLMGIMFLQLTGTTLSMIVLFALILALGMLVDNGIVVVENIYRHMQKGYSRWDAAKYGTGEVAVPIIVSTATTLVAFLPLAFWPGLIGNFMYYLPFTLILVLLSSLFVALVINPVLTYKLMKVQDIDKINDKKRRRKTFLIWVIVLFFTAIVFHFMGVLWLRNLLALALLVTILNYFLFTPLTVIFQKYVLPWIEKVYDIFISFALKKYNPLFFFFGTILLMFFSIMLLGVRQPKVLFFPETDPNYVNVFVELPMGTDILETDKLVKKLEVKINNAIKPYKKIVESVLVQIGENTGDPNGPREPGSSPNKARITVSFVADDLRGDLSSEDAMKAIQTSVRDVVGANIIVDKDKKGPPTGKPINIEIKGEDIDKLIDVSHNVIKYINSHNIPGIEELKADIKIGKPEILIKIDRGAARRYGLSTFSIADAIRTSVYGKEVSKFKKGEEEYPIMLRLADKYRYQINDLLNQRVTFRNPNNGRIVQVPISSVASIKYASTFSSIKRKNQDRVVTIYSNVLAGYNANEIVKQLKTLMHSYPMIKGYEYSFTGEQKEQAENTAFLMNAFLVALFLIFLLLVAQFNSVLSPFIIMFSVIFSTIGVFLGLVVNNQDIVIVMTGVGIISLAGVVVNNAIVLIDYTNLTIGRRRKELGLPNNKLPLNLVKEGIIQAGTTRLRPVLLTAITTVLGML